MQSERGAGSSDWLETIDGDESILLIAPHGGHAGSASRATLHPKVNDLYTAEITRELARVMGGSALINAGMDRNEIDCNRIEQLAKRAPWLLEMIAQRTELIVQRHGQATIILIHGWNIIEPRLDYGLGLRSRNGALVPAGAACVSASDGFINGPLNALSLRLERHGIKPTFGLRYPGGALQNLLQAFTQRHRLSELGPLRRLCNLAADYRIDAVQLELSVALRLPGRIRARAMEAIAASFGEAALRKSAEAESVDNQGGNQVVVRSLRPLPPRPAPKVVPNPARIGIEFYDSRAKIGAMASFDIGAGANGGRILVMLGGRRVALFTGEGRPIVEENRITLGPLGLLVSEGRVEVSFSGAAIIVPDGTAYLSIERAIGSGAIDDAVKLSGELQMASAGSLNLSSLIRGVAQGDSVRTPIARFGRLLGGIQIDGHRQSLDASARIGFSMTGPGPFSIKSRRTIWAHFPRSPRLQAAEARSVSGSDGERDLGGRLYVSDGPRECEVERVDIEAVAPEDSPAVVSADLPSAQRLLGAVESFIPLSRPGPGGTRIYTSLGFARFRMGELDGVGMYEYSRRSDPPDSEDREDSAED
jgi:hypothetical protein